MGGGNCFKGRHFTAEVILWAVRWYLMFPMSYRDLELMLLDRGVEVDHTTIFRWIEYKVAARGIVSIGGLPSVRCRSADYPASAGPRAVAA